jgi:hypothetical protein
MFQIDVTVCPDCGGRMKIIAALTARASVCRYLEGVGLAGDGAAAHYDGGEFLRAVSWLDEAQVLRVEAVDGQAIETAQPTQRL